MFSPYDAGREAAKVAFFGELYDQVLKGRAGPIAGGLITSHPLAAGGAGAIGSLLDDNTSGDFSRRHKALRAVGVGGGSALMNALVHPVAKIVAAAVVSKLPISPSGEGARLLKDLLAAVPTGAAQQFVASKGQSAADHIEKSLKKKEEKKP